MMLKCAAFGRNGGLKGHAVYQYNPNHHEAIIQYYNAESKLLYYAIHSYEDKHVIRISAFNGQNNALSFYSTIEYIQANHVIQYNHFDGDNGAITSSFIHVHAKRKQQQQMVAYAANGTLNRFAQVAYDNDDRILEKHWYDNEGTLSHRITYQYDNYLGTENIPIYCMYGNTGLLIQCAISESVYKI